MGLKSFQRCDNIFIENKSAGATAGSGLKGIQCPNN